MASNGRQPQKIIIGISRQSLTGYLSNFELKLRGSIQSNPMEDDIKKYKLTISATTDLIGPW